MHHRTACGWLLALLLALAGCRQQLYASLSERDANEMIAVLASRGITAQKSASDKGDFLIEVEHEVFSASVDVLREHGLPRAKFSSIGEVFKKEGLVTTANAERLRFMYAMSEELSRTLSLIDGVVEARVHPVLPGGDPLTDKITPASASVFIKHTPDADLRMLAPAIKDLVHASIEGLSYDKVSLTFVPAVKGASVRVPSASATAEGVAGGAQPWTAWLSPLGVAVALVLLGAGVVLPWLRLRDPAPAAAAASTAALPTRLQALLQRARQWRRRSAAPPPRPPAAAEGPTADASAAEPGRDAVVPLHRHKRAR